MLPLKCADALALTVAYRDRRTHRQALRAALVLSAARNYQNSRHISLIEVIQPQKLKSKAIA